MLVDAATTPFAKQAEDLAGDMLAALACERSGLVLWRLPWPVARREAYRRLVGRVQKDRAQWQFFLLVHRDGVAPLEAGARTGMKPALAEAFVPFFWLCVDELAWALSAAGPKAAVG